MAVAFIFSFCDGFGAPYSRHLGKVIRTRTIVKSSFYKQNKIDSFDNGNRFNEKGNISAFTEYLLLWDLSTVKGHNYYVSRVLTAMKWRWCRSLRVLDTSRRVHMPESVHCTARYIYFGCRSQIRAQFNVVFCRVWSNPKSLREVEAFSLLFSFPKICHICDVFRHEPVVCPVGSRSISPQHPIARSATSTSDRNSGPGKSTTSPKYGH